MHTSSPVDKVYVLITEILQNPLIKPYNLIQVIYQFSTQAEHSGPF